MSSDNEENEDNGVPDIDEIRQKAKEIIENKENVEPKINEESKESKESKETPRPGENGEIPDEKDLFDIVAANSKKDEKVFPEGNELIKLECFFKKVDISKPKKDLFTEKDFYNFTGSYGIFYCYKKNDITKCTCEPEKEICTNCMKNTQKMYGLKPHYLINSMGRVCTYKRGKIYCLGKFSRILEDSTKKNNIKYSFNYVCGHSGQCDSCKSLTEKMDKYFAPELMKKLKERDDKYKN